VQVRQRRGYGDWGFAQDEWAGVAPFAGEAAPRAGRRVLANDLPDLYRIDLSAVVSKYVGETEKNLRRLFDAAEDGGAICSSMRPTRCSQRGESRTATTVTLSR
jgi:hypothetical protein